MAGKFFYEHNALSENLFEDRLGIFETKYSREHGIIEAKLNEYENKKVKFSYIKDVCIDNIYSMLMMHYRSGAMMYELKFWKKGSQKKFGLIELISRFHNSRYLESFTQTLIDYYKFCILKSNNNDFLISDRYISSAALSFKARFMDTTNRSVGQRDVAVFLPVSKKYYICFFNGRKPSYIKSNKLNYLDERQTLEVNKVIINNSYMETAGPSEEALSKAGHMFRYESPVGIFFGGGAYSGGFELGKEVFFYDDDYSIFKFIENPSRWPEFQKATKNEHCPCGSGKQFRDCCRYKLNAFKKFMKRIEQQEKNGFSNPYSIPNCDFLEMNIDQFYRNNS